MYTTHWCRDYMGLCSINSSLRSLSNNHFQRKVRDPRVVSTVAHLNLPLKATEFSAKAQQTATELSAKVPFIWLTGERRSGCSGWRSTDGTFFFSNGTGWASNVKWQSLVFFGFFWGYNSYSRFVSQNIVVGNVCPQKGLSTNQFSKI